MKKYNLEIFIDQENVRVEGVHEKSEEMTIDDLRLVISILEQYKVRLLLILITKEQVNDLTKSEAKKVE